jgi:hypothetical protein
MDVIPDGYLDLVSAEEDASRIVHFHPTFVPGLLQTERYATAVTPATALKDMIPRKAATLVQVRMLRQRAALDRSRRKRLVFLMDEACLYRPVGSAAIMHEQLLHLLEMHAHPMVSLTVVPFRAQPHPGLLGPFTILQYADGLDEVLCFEWQRGNTLVRDDPDLVRRYRDLADLLARSDPDGQTAKRLVGSALGRLAGSVGGASPPTDRRGE